MQSIVIGVVNSAIGTGNMGCSALTYSLIHLLNQLCDVHSLSATSCLFDTGSTEEHKNLMCEAMGFEKDKISIYYMPHFDKRSLMGRIRTLKHTLDNRHIYDAMKKCAFLVDLTQGDSFSDIYGPARFYRWTDIKKEIEDKGFPLVLGPQTYGPFSDTAIREYAIRVIEGAKAVISRDQVSADYVKQYSEKKCTVGTDLAFELPYTKRALDSKGRMRVGINPSGLLCRTKADGSGFFEEMKTDYESYLTQVIDWLRKAESYEIHMISHVGNEATISFGGVQDAIYHPAFKTPVEAKNLISGMDVFIGARMHATIAAFSSGVPVIPTAYSRKFSGLFRGLGYDHLIDLKEMTTEESVKRTIAYLENVDMLREDMIKSSAVLDSKRRINYEFFENILREMCR